MKNLLAKIRYWLAWELAGQRIWNKAIMWAAQNIHLYSSFEKAKVISLPKGITVADEQVVLSSDMVFEGGGHILTQAVNKRFESTIEVAPGSERVLVTGVVIIGHHNMLPVDKPSVAIHISKD